jgi:uncharacterized protein YodC (DUF2158 family)
MNRAQMKRLEQDDGSTFKVGDIVQLKSGGPPMTISDLRKNGKVSCSWFADIYAVQHSQFSLDTLKLVVSPVL